MPIKPRKITTSADLLMSLLRDVKEISVDEAAKTLGVPAATVENWATFLEEERALSIKYKFTTPYLVYGQVSASKKPSEHFEERLLEEEGREEGKEDVKESLKKAGELADKAAHEARKGDFSLVKQTIPSLLSKARSFKERIPFEPAAKVGFERRLNEMELLLQKANYHVDTGKFDLASGLYSSIQSGIKELLSSMEAAHRAVESEQEKEKLTDMRQILEKAYVLMKEGRLDDAKSLYERLRQGYYGLPREFMERKVEMEKNLVKLNKDLSATLDRQAIELMKEGEKRIAALVSVCRDSMSKSDFARAEGVYYEIKRTFENLPSGFDSRKKGLEAGILRLFELISVKRRNMLTGMFSAKAGELVSLIKAINYSLKAGKLDEAVLHYNEAKKAYASLPEGFVNEKLKLQEQIMPIYHDLASAYAELSSRKMDDGSRRILELLAGMKAHIDSGASALAYEAYESVKSAFRSLPPGFVAEKVDLQNRTISVYEYLLSKSGDSLNRDVKAKAAAIGRMLDEANAYLRQGKPELAEEVYSEIVSLYSALPAGFAYEKSALRERILNLYREIMLGMDVSLLRTTTPDVNRMYHDILKLLVQLWRNLEKREFELLEHTYHKIRKIFNELPLGFVQEKFKLRDNVAKMAEKVDFYRKIMAAEKAAQERSYELRSLLSEALRFGERLANDPDSKPLLEFFEQKKQFLMNELARVENNAQASRRAIGIMAADASGISAASAPLTATPVVASASESVVKADSQSAVQSTAHKSQVADAAQAFQVPDEIYKKISRLRESVRPAVKMPMLQG
ncbi:hypothetical protein HYV82_01395 [Candidatus Woesearchaeota archaeon]|nr:hypothetical protein [Candidatus Woesearchaeota archaeon]